MFATSTSRELVESVQSTEDEAAGLLLPGRNAATGILTYAPDCMTRHLRNVVVKPDQTAYAYQMAEDFEAPPTTSMSSGPTRAATVSFHAEPVEAPVDYVDELDETWTAVDAIAEVDAP